MSRHADAESHLRVLLEDAKDDGELTALLGQCLFETGKKDEAKQLFESPAIDQMPTSATAFILRSGYWSLIGQYDKAFRDANRAMELQSEDNNALWLAANAQIRLGNEAEALSFVLEGIEKWPGDGRFYRTLAELQLRSGELEQALESLRKGRQNVQQDTELSITLAQLLLGLGSKQEAEEVVGSLARNESTKLLVELLEGRVAMAKNQFGIALDRLQTMQPKAAGIPDLQRETFFWAGRCYEELGDRDAAARSFRRAVEIDWTYARARSALANILKAANRYEEAVFEQRTLVNLEDAPPGATAKLVAWMIQKNHSLPESRRNWSPVSEIVDEFEAKNASPIDVLLLRSEVLIAQGNVEEAERLVRQGLTKFPDDEQLTITLSELVFRRGGNVEAEQLLSKATSAKGDSLAIRLARARRVLRRQDLDASLRIRELAEVNLEALSSLERLDLWRSLLPIAIQLDDLALAKDISASYLEKMPTDLDVRLQLFELAMQLNDDKESERALQEIQAIDGEHGPFRHFATAIQMLATAEGEDVVPQVLKHLDEAEKRRPSWWRIFQLRAAVFDRQGENEKAIEQYERAIELGRIGPAALRRAVEIALDLRDYERANRLVAKLQADHILENPRLETLDYRLQSLVDFTAALDEAQAKVNSRDYKDHLWHGQLLVIEALRQRGLGEVALSEAIFANAESELQKATSLAPTEPAPWIALVRFYAGIEKAKEAKDSISLATKNLSDAQRPQALAVCYQAVGQPDEAVAQYQTALEMAPQDLSIIRSAAEFCFGLRRRQIARTHLQSILTGEIDAARDDIIWARRLYALTLALEDNFPGLKKAIELIDQNLTENPTSQLDLRTKATLLETHPQPAMRKLALETMEKLAASVDALTQEERIVMARLYAANGRWPDARRHFRTLVSPVAVASYVSSLLVRNELDEAERVLERLERAAPSASTTVALRASLLIRKGEYQTALEKVQGLIPDGEIKGGDLESVVRIAEQLETFAERQMPRNSQYKRVFLKEAERLYRRYAESVPDGKLILAAFLGRTGKSSDALALLEQGELTTDLGKLALACSGIIQGSGNSQATLKRVEKVVLKAYAKNKKDVGLLSTLMQLYMSAELFDNVEKVYRQVLVVEPDNWLAMNNLAELLALRQTQLDEALQLIQEAIQLAGPIANLLDTRGMVHLARNDVENALADMNASIEASKSPNRFFHRALAFNQAGDQRAARAELAVAVQLGLSSSDIHPLERKTYLELKSSLGN